MPTKKPDDSGSVGLGFANVLRDCLVSGVIFVDAAQKHATLTPEAQHLLGKVGEDPVSKPLETLPVRLVEIAREAAASDRPTAAREISIEVPQRGATQIRVVAMRLKSQETDSGIALVLNDLTAARRFEDHIQALDRLANAGTLAASMAHEIKNAMVAGKTFVDLLLEQNQKSELVDVVRREMGRIDAIVGRMLKLAGPARAMFSMVHVHEILEHSLRLVQPHMETKSILVEQFFRASQDEVNGDEYELQQAFVNLLLNAFEAMGPEGTLSISTELVTPKDSATPQVCVTIKDTGAGILPEHMRHLFEPFFTTKASGTGLGLAVTQRICQEHHGNILVESQPGTGTTFHVMLPAGRAAS
jgi:signal transduction histidine kinase